jgi:multidrug efflux system outer membrane protein
MHEIRAHTVEQALSPVRALLVAAAAALATMALTGSTGVGQQPPGQPIGEPTAAVGVQARSEAGGNQFWLALGDPVLDQLMERALLGNRDLRSADARVAVAEAGRLQAALDLTPALNARAGYARQRLASAMFPGAGVLPDQDVWESSLALSWELDLFGRLRGGLRARNAFLGAAGEDARHAHVAVSSQLARSYFDLRGAQGQLAVAQRNAENQRRTLQVTEIREAAGRGTAFDTERARAQLSLTLAAIPLLEERVAAGQYRIAVLVGRSPRELEVELATVAELPELPDMTSAESPTELIGRRPDVLSAEGRLDAGRALIDVARADYLPRVTLAAGAGYTANAFDAFGDRGTFNYMFGPVISWGALDLGRVKARVDEAQALELDARARYEQVVLLAEEEIEAAAVRYRSARARLEHLRAAAEASERAAALALLRYEGGIADFLQVLDAERTLLAAQDQLAQGRTQAANAYVTLYEARGGR